MHVSSIKVHCLHDARKYTVYTMQVLFRLLRGHVAMTLWQNLVKLELVAVQELGTYFNDLYCDSHCTCVYIQHPPTQSTNYPHIYIYITQNITNQTRFLLRNYM